MKMQQQCHYQSADHGTLNKNVNKDGICLLGLRPIDPKQRIKIFKHRDETEVSKIL